MFSEREKREGERHSKQAEREREREKQGRDVERKTDRPGQTLAWEAGGLDSGCSW